MKFGFVLIILNFSNFDSDLFVNWLILSLFSLCFGFSFCVRVSFVMYELMFSNLPFACGVSTEMKKESNSLPNLWHLNKRYASKYENIFFCFETYHCCGRQRQLQLMKDCSVDGQKSISCTGFGNFLLPIYPRRTVQFIQPYFNIGTWLYLWTLI